MTDETLPSEETEAEAVDVSAETEASAAEGTGSETVEDAADEDAAGSTSEDGGDAGDEDGAEEVEIDFGGNKLSVRKADIPDEVLEKVQGFAKDTWAEHTRRSQEVAEQRKQVEARQEAVNRLAGLQGEALETFSRGQALRAEIQQLSQVDLGALWQSDPDRARRTSDLISQKQAEFQQTVSKVRQIEAEQARTQETEFSRQREVGKAEVERRIKGFRAEEVIDYVVSKHGIDRAVAERDWPMNPAMTVLAHKAMLYDRMQAKAKASAAPKTPTAQPVKAAAKKGGGSGRPVAFSAADPNGDSIASADEWAKKRMEQMAKRKRA